MYQTIYVPKFSFLHWIKTCKEPPCPQTPELGFWRTLEVPDWGFGSWPWLGWVYNVPNYNVPKFSLLHWIKKCKEPSCPQSPGLWFWRTLEVPEWGFGSWSWWWWVYNVPKYLCSEIQLSTLNKKVQRTLMSLKSWTGDLDDSGGSWLGFWFLIMMRMGLQCPKLPMFWNSASYIE